MGERSSPTSQKYGGCVSQKQLSVLPPSLRWGVTPFLAWWRMCPVSSGGNPGIVQKCQACKHNTSIGKLTWKASECCNVGCKLQGWLLTKTTDPSLWNVRPLSPKIGFCLFFFSMRDTWKFFFFSFVSYSIIGKKSGQLTQRSSARTKGSFLVAHWPKMHGCSWVAVEAVNQEAALGTSGRVLGCYPLSAHAVLCV